MTNVAVVTPTDRVLYGSQVPFILMGYDTYGNPVEQTTTTYKLSASAGTIISNGTNASSLELQQFGPLNNYYADLTTLSSNPSSVDLTLEPINAPAGTVAPRITKRLTLTQGNLNIKYNTQTTSHIDLTLPENTTSYFQTQNGVAQLQESALPRIVLTLTASDGRPLDSAAVIRSTN